MTDRQFTIIFALWMLPIAAGAGAALGHLALYLEFWIGFLIVLAMGTR